MPGDDDATASARPPPLPPALARLFASPLFDATMALTYLLRPPAAPGARAAAAARLATRPEAELGCLLPQLVNLALAAAVEGEGGRGRPGAGSRPCSGAPGTPARCEDGAASARTSAAGDAAADCDDGGDADAAALGDLLVALSRRSLLLGARIHWLLAAEAAAGATAPPPPSSHAAAAAALRDACERAALQGSWEPPFPPAAGGGGGRARPTSPLAAAARRALSPPPPAGASVPTSPREPLSPVLSMSGSEDGGGSAAASPPPHGRRARHPLAPAGGSFASAAAAAGAAAGLEGLFCSSPPPVAPSPAALAAAAGGDGRPRPPPLVVRPGSPQHHDRHDDHRPTSPASLRASTFGATLDFVEALTDAAAGLASVPPADRAAALARGLAEIDREVRSAGAPPVAFPLPPPLAGGGGGARPERVVRLLADRATLLNSRDKAPFLVWVEVVGGGDGGGGGGEAEEEEEEEEGEGAGACGGAGGCGQTPPPPAAGVPSLATAFAGLAAGDGSAPAHRPSGHARVPSDEALAAVAAAARAAAAGEAGGAAALAAALAAGGGACLLPPGGGGGGGGGASRPVTPPTPSPPVPAPEGGDGDGRGTAAARRLYGPRAADLAGAVRAASPHAAAPGWALRPLIVKAGDDGRQEALAVGLLAALDAAWAGAGLPPAMRAAHCAAIPAGAAAALVEALPNAPSLHALKRALAAAAAAAGHGRPPATLAQHFAAAHPPGTPDGGAALSNFVASLAAGSLATYLLALRDRHNGNLLLAADGRLVHVDFGFMLGASPGGIGFESAPFKLSRELMEVMGVGVGAAGAAGAGATCAAGPPAPTPSSSPAFDAFRLLFVRGLLAARPVADALATQVEAAGAGPGSSLPCFRAAGGPGRAAAALRSRLLPGLSDGRAVSAALALVDASADAWRTRQYDYYQRVLNGIL